MQGLLITILLFKTRKCKDLFKTKIRARVYVTRSSSYDLLARVDEIKMFAFSHITLLFTRTISKSATYNQGQS